MAARAYNGAWPRQRREAIAALMPGVPCQECGLPMWRDAAEAIGAGWPAWTGKLQLDHVQPVRFYGGGGPTRLLHEKCNARRGQRLTVQILRAQLEAGVIDKWPGTPGARSARSKRRLEQARKARW